MNDNRIAGGCRRLALLMLCLLTLTVSGCYSRRTVSEEIPKRVLILHPSATEAMLELDLGKYIAETVNAYGEIPPALREQFQSLPKIRAPFIPAQEEILEL